MISDLEKYIYILYCVIQKIEWFLISFNFEMIDKYYRGANVLNQSINFVFQKHHQKKKMKWSFFKHRKRRFVLSSIYMNKILWLLRTQRDLPSRIRAKEGMGPIEFLRFRVDNSIHPITTGNHKRKSLLNQSQEYQLQYLLAKKESFQ